MNRVKPKMKIGWVLFFACLLLSLIVGAASVYIAKMMRVSFYKSAFQKESESLEKQLLSHTIHSQLMGAVISNGLNQLDLKQAVSKNGSDAGALIESRETLKPLRERFHLDGIYLVDSDGVVVMHDTDGRSSTGTNVAFRPYFKQAMAGHISIYAAVGNNTSERGLYYAAPLYATTSNTSSVIGVVLAKAPGDSLDEMLKKFGDAALLLSPQGIVFASSREDWLYAIAGKADAARLEAIRGLKQFGKYFETNEPTPLPIALSGEEADFGGARYSIEQTPFDWGDPAGDWRIVTLWNTSRVNPPGLLAGIGIAGGGLTLLLTLMTAVIVDGRKRHRQAQQRFKFLGTALETSPLAVIMADAAGKIRWVNPQFERSTQYGPDEALGNDPKLLSSGLTAKETIRELWESLLAGRSWAGEFVNKRKDGSLYHAASVVTPVMDENGRRLGYVCLQNDVTDQKRAEQTIRSAQTEMTQIFNTAAGGMRVIDKDCNVLKVNDAFVALSGYPREELTGSKCYDLFAGDDCHTEQCPLSRILQGEERIEELSLRRHRDGMPIYCEVNITPYTTPDGEIVGAIEDFRDVTERMRAQHRIKQSESKYRELVESASSIILKLDMDGTITFFNEYALAFFGYAADEVVGRSIVGTIIADEDGERRHLRTLLGDIGEHPQDYASTESENICKDGRRVWISWTNKVIRDDITDKPKGVLRIGLDATERKKAQDGLHSAMEIISGSIRYASRIQRAILPTPEQCRELVPRHFAVWEPRDVVGGDIYWVRTWGEGVLFILADCTGHGVPGAFITLIASGALDRAVSEVAPGDPAALIALMNRYVKVVLSQDLDFGAGEGSDDGLELGVCYIAPDRQSLVFAGAHFQLFCAGGEGIDLVKGDRKGIGYRFVSLDASFANQTVPASPGQRFYMTTDGLIDQIGQSGGSPRRSFGKKRFVSLLASLQDRPLDEHGEAIFATIEAFRGQETRRDDICVIGFELEPAQALTVNPSLG